MALHSSLKESSLARLNDRASEIALDVMRAVVTEHGSLATVRPGETAIMLLLSRQVALLEDIKDSLQTLNNKARWFNDTSSQGFSRMDA